MERKIGEIFEYNGEWYQCVEGCNCGNCYFYYDGFNECTYDLTGECNARNKYGGCNFIFKKLEKVGEPVTINGTLVQKMKTPVAIGCKQCVLNNNGCSIVYEKCFSNELYVSKQDQENMEEKKFNLKEFDIEAAKAGKPVCTRDGGKARIICFDKKCRAIEGEELPIVALLYDERSKREIILDYTKYGKSRANGEPSTSDLMMLPEKKEGWVNIYQKEQNRFVKGIFPSKDKAIESISEIGRKYIDTVKIEWNE